MSSDAVCRFNQFGYCKFENRCFRKHVNIICENARCRKIKCELRHPRKCIYFLKHSYCKFGEYCKYSHDKDKNFIDIAKEVEELKLEIEALKKENKSKEAEIQKLVEGDQNKMKKKN